MSKPIIDRATEGIRHSRAFQAAAAFGVPTEAHADCAHHIASDLDEKGLLVPADRLRAFAAECVEHGDMTPAAARMLNRILDDE